MKIGIVGMGLIGGSLGLDLVQQGHQVIGIARRQETCDLAVQMGAVHQASSNFELLTAAEVVFVCTPIAAIANTITQLAPYLDSQAIITDVGSVKAAVVETATSLWPRFVGGHPMAGKAEAGLAVAETGLFTDCAYVITPTPKSDRAAIATVAQLAKDLQARVYECDPEVHDRAVAWISHLPVVVSSSLIQACLSEPNSDVGTLARALASSGFRDTSRVGGGNPELGLMMARYNREALLRSLHSYRQQLDQMIDVVQAEDWDSFQSRLETTQAARPEFVD